MAMGCWIWVLYEGQSTEVWHNRGEAGFAPILHLPYGHWGSGLGDGDGDGDVDLVVIESRRASGMATRTRSYSVTLWVNDGRGWLCPGGSVGPRRLPTLPAGRPISGRGGAPVVESTLRPADGSLAAEPSLGGPTGAGAFLCGGGQPLRRAPAGRSGWRWPCGSTRFPGAESTPLRLRQLTTHGLALWRLDGSGVLAHHTLFDSEVFFRGRGIARDLNGDGLLDVALVDINSGDGSGADGAARSTRGGTRAGRALSAAGQGRSGAGGRCGWRWG